LVEAVKVCKVTKNEKNDFYGYTKEFLKRRIVGVQYEWESHINNIFEIFDKNLKNYKAENMLDVGCATGERTVRIADYLKIKIDKIYGVDYEDQYVNESKNKFNAFKVDLEINNLPFENNTFSLVVCNQVIEHLKEYKKVIENIIRVTHKNGYIVLGVPNLGHLINRINLLFGIQPMCISLDGLHVRAFTHKAFVKMLKSFEGIELIDYAGALMYPIPFYFSKYLII
jgi:ubiquinone/menaquinone biosynthesis C-methylase UbiE